MAPAPQPDRDQIRDAVQSRYSGLARAVQAGETVTDTDGDAGAFAEGCFGAAGYPNAGELPGGAVRASLGGRGAGRRLLDALIASTEAAGIWTIQSGIFPENTASLALHRAAGLRVVGIRERIGEHHGRWRDVVLIERRSPVV